MKTLEDPEIMQDLSESWRIEERTVGLVPTMGALHEGHLSLIRRARIACDRVVVSIFVNPTQFGRGEDFETYRRPFERDSALLDEEGCDVLFAPTVETMYGGSSLDLSPSGGRSYIEVGGLGEIWEGEARPGHMRGVATVVAMLFNIARPHRAYFGEKDYQQLKIIERMVRTFFFGIEIVPCPTVREPDGLAMSSRNLNLSAEERGAATVLHRALGVAANLKQQGEPDAANLVAAMRKVCDTEPLVSLQYAAVVDADTLAPLDAVDDGPARAIIAARVGETRLIDNIEL